MAPGGGGAAAGATSNAKQRGGGGADPVGALRKNKAYQQLRREMEQRNRMRRKDTSAQDRVTY